MANGVKVSKLNFELNPRGNLWFNDETTFGHKLLSKMGWSKGKGLGKNEDGIKENIKISKQETNSGVGWKSNEIPVAVGCLEYEDILQNLQKHFKSKQEKFGANERFEKSLEQRSRSARNHLHYQKFVRVKDLNRYSEKDMKSIFLEKPQKPAREHPSFHPHQTPTFNSQLSVSDYFALKMQRKKEETRPSEITTENNVLPLSQPINENLSKKRKFVLENPENATAKKAKLKKKSFEDEMSSTEDNSVIDKKPESPESASLKKAKLKKKSFEDEMSSTEDNSVKDKKPESASLKKANLKKKSFEDEMSSREDNSVIDKEPESPEIASLKKAKLKKKSFKDELSSTEDNSVIDKKPESPESASLKKAELKKKSFEDEMSSTENNSVIDKKSENPESASLKKARLKKTKDNSVIDKKPESKKSGKCKKKVKKLKKNKLHSLKSCLKSRADYDFEGTRNVSFNEQVSYKILDTSLELCGEINDLTDPSVDEAACGDETVIVSDGELDHKMLSNESRENEESDITNEEESGAEEPQCLDLPKCSGSNFNFWLESQRQASKMKIYKEMMKKIKKNKILRSTNLLDIKGYGNWSL